jgi:hypothetical protein
MKKLFLLLSFVYVANFTFAQSQKLIFDDTDINALDIDFVELFASGRGILYSSNLYFGGVDYGQKKFRRNQVIKDENGKIVSLNSNIDLLNYFSRRG